MLGVNCAIFIWYPEHGNIGHCAMYIGDYQNACKSDDFLSVSYEDLAGYQACSPEELQCFSWPQCERYVSWWPANEGTGSKHLCKCKKDYADIPMLDCISEGCPPHVVYFCSGLNEIKMLEKWQQIKSKPGAN